jgi:hypothetical protein
MALAALRGEDPGCDIDSHLAEYGKNQVKLGFRITYLTELAYGYTFDDPTEFGDLMVALNELAQVRFRIANRDKDQGNTCTTS